MLENYQKLLQKRFDFWASSNSYRLIFFNLIVWSLFLLRSAGYFSPYFLITINIIVFIAIILSIFILRIKSGVLFVTAIIFWMFAGFLRLLGIDVWAERTSIYVYEILVVALVLFVFEICRNKYEK